MDGCDRLIVRLISFLSLMVVMSANIYIYLNEEACSFDLLGISDDDRASEHLS